MTFSIFLSPLSPKSISRLVFIIESRSMSQSSAGIHVQAHVVDPESLLKLDVGQEFDIDRIRHRLFRESLRTDDSDAELLATVLNEIESIVNVELLSPSDLTVALFRNLCGVQPLTLPTLRRFLEIVALACCRAIRSRLEPSEQPDKNTPDTAQSSSGVVKTITATRASVETDLSLKFRTPAGINFMTARAEPNVVRRKLDLLSQLQEQDPLGALWFSLYEFTAATPAEIGTYYAQPTNMIQVHLDGWLAEFRI
jgi:hypothetical protein